MLTVFYGLIAARRVNILRRESCRVSCGRIHPCFMIRPPGIETAVQTPIRNEPHIEQRKRK